MSSFNIIDFLEQHDISYKRDLSLSEISSYKIGGKSDLTVYPGSKEELCLLLDCFKQNSIKFHIFGNCSNVIFPDEGLLNPVIITTNINNKSLNSDGVSLYAECGLSLTSFSVFASECSLSGLEFAYGIPGSVGGAVFMNAGAYGGCVSDIITEADAYNVETGEIVRFTKDEMNFGYRHSIFNERNNLIVLSAVFSLTPSDSESVKSLMKENMNKRLEKQPLNYPSCGSVFKRYPGYYTGKIIQDSGLAGYTVGGAQISTKHCGFIINTGNATAKDVLELIGFIKDKIKEKYGIELETEVKTVRE